MGIKSKNISGNRYGNLIAVKEISRHRSTHKWEFLCIKCNTKFVTDKYSVTSLGTTQCKRCGYSHSKTHGESLTRLYKIWTGVKQRCLNPNVKNYKNYGGRGIKIKWESYEDFKRDMINGYSDSKSIERIDNNGDYCKENCRWATRHEQNRNYRRNIKYNGETAIDAAKRLGGGKSLVSMRVRYGWSLEDAFNRPKRI